MVASCDYVAMEFDADPEKTIAELERKLAEAKAAQQRRAFTVPPAFPAPPPMPMRRPTRKPVWRSNPGLIGGLFGAFGFCAGMGSALTAVVPDSALWTSVIVCGSPGRLISNSSSYSYAPGQGGTTVSFQCLESDGATTANWFAITALQTLPIIAIALGVGALVLLIRRRSRREPVSGGRRVAALCLAGIAVVSALGVGWSAVRGTLAPAQLPPGGTLAIDGNGDTKDIVCNNGQINVDGRDVTVNITGHCTKITVDGVINHVTVDSADEIIVDGLQNVVKYHSGSPKISDPNGQNKISQG